jgi:hypothetical protein
MCIASIKPFPWLIERLPTIISKNISGYPGGVPAYIISFMENNSCIGIALGIQLKN